MNGFGMWIRWCVIQRRHAWASWHMHHAYASWFPYSYAFCWYLFMYVGILSCMSFHKLVALTHAMISGILSIQITALSARFKCIIMLLSRDLNICIAGEMEVEFECYVLPGGRCMNMHDWIIKTKIPKILGFRWVSFLLPIRLCYSIGWIPHWLMSLHCL